MAKPLEIVEHCHFEVGARQRRRKLLADGVEGANACLFFDTFGKSFLGSRGPFLGRWLVSGNGGVHPAFFITAHGEDRSRLAPVCDHGGVCLRARPLYSYLPVLTLSWSVCVGG